MARSVAKGGVSGQHETDRGWWQKFQVSLGNLIFNSSALTIGSSSKKAAKLANTVYGVIDGVMFSKTTAEVALAGTVTNAKFNVYLILVNAAGTLSVVMGTEGATLAAAVLPAVTAGCAVVGMVIVNPTGTGNFVGGTTDLDDATVVPNAVYVNTPFPFNYAEQTLA